MKKLLYSVMLFFLSLQCACVLVNTWKRQNEVVEDLSAANYVSAQRVSSDTATPTHTIRLHVMVDESYRREQLRWRTRIEEHVNATSEELRLLFGVELEVVAIEEWDYDGGTRSLDEVLTDVRAAHPVSDAEDRVLGFTSSLAAPTSQQHQLGVAYELGEHLVLRGMQDHAEREFIQEALSLRTRHLSDSIYRSRLEHKRTTVLIHELGHSFGAMHVKGGGQLMSPIYDHKVHHFSPVNTTLLEAAFELDRELVGQSHAVWQRAFLARLSERHAQQDPLLADLPQADLERRLAATATDTSPDVMTLDAVSAAIEREEFELAWSTLRPQLDAEPTVRAINMACIIQANLASDRDALKTWCARTVKAGGEPVAYAAFMLVRALVDEEPVLAFDYTRVYEGVLNDMTHTTPQDWLQLSAFYAGSGALTHAERVTALAGMTREAAKLRADIVTERHALSLFDVPEDSEPVIHRALMVLEPSLQSEDPDAHTIALAKLEALGPDLAPVIVARCRVAVARRDTPKVKKLCVEAAAKVPQSAMALWGLGIAQMLKRKDRDAVRTLERAIALEPALTAPWSALAHHHTLHTHTDELDALRQRYKDQFDAAPSW